MGRKSKYETHVLPNLDKITEWKKQGATDEKICKALGISIDAFYRYKNENNELNDALKKGTQDFVSDLRGELARIAFKHTLKTTKRVIKPTGTDDEGNPTYSKHIEETEKEVDGDIAALHLLLKNYDKENWSDKPRELDLKQQELELRRMLAEAREFDFGNIDTKDG